MKILLCVLLSLFWWNLLAFNIIPTCMRNCERKSSPNENLYEFNHSKDHWFIQKLDHLDRNNEKTWKQRYRVIDKYYNSKKNGPIFLYAGGEEAVPIRIGAWLSYAEKLNALCFFLEHRYYGTSRPTKNLSTENLIYLSIKQALADLALFIVDIPKLYKKHKIPKSAKWVVFGGSYSGLLAVWLRKTYPDLVYTAVASSAPLVAKLDFKEYFTEVENTLASYKQECASKIKEATQMIENLLQTTEGQNEIRSKFKVCESQQEDNNINANDIFKTLRSYFSRLVSKGHYEDSSVSFETLCDIMAEDSNRSAVDRLAAVNNLMLPIKVWNCTLVSHTYIDEMIAILDYGIHVFRQWQYQSCTELGLFQTSSKNDSIFRIDDPIDNYVGECNRLFSNEKNLEQMSATIEKTNERYGGLDIQANRIIYVNGSQDPWRSLGITRTKIKNTISIYIKGAAHCKDSEYPCETDLPETKKAREYVLFHLQKLLTGFNFDKNIVIE